MHEIPSPMANTLNGSDSDSCSSPGAKVRVIALNNGGITRKSLAFTRVIMQVNSHISPKTHILHMNWREVEFAAIYTSKALTIDTREISREHTQTRVNGRAAFAHRLCAPLN